MRYFVVLTSANWLDSCRVVLKKMADEPTFLLNFPDLNMEQNDSERFPNIPEEELDKMREQNQNKNIQKTTNTWIKMFDNWRVKRREEHFSSLLIPANESPRVYGNDMVISGILEKISICLLLRSLCIAGITTGFKKRRLNSK